jgi:hypothetical protein
MKWYDIVLVKDNVIPVFNYLKTTPLKSSGLVEV